MGCIYKATNLINNKIYIGLTSSSLQRRISRHINDSSIENPKYVFHKAMRKYGADNFTFEILEDNIYDKDKLKAKENFYILKYKSYNQNGYNSTVGGEGESLFLGRECEVIDKYNELNNNCIEVAKYFNCNRQTIARLLKDNNIKPQCGAGARKAIYCIELNMTFKSMKQCAEYLINMNYIDFNNPLRVSQYISRAIIENKSYLNFNFKKV